MCRFIFYRGETLPLSAILTEPENSLIHQSTHARERAEPLNGDGFGVSWYGSDQERPGLFRSTSPAWSNQNLRSLARVVESPCVLAHVRAASEGLEVMETNTHPFQRGRYSFMHNGAIGGFATLRRPIQASLSDETFRALRGTTDSEHLFALFMDAIEAAGEGLEADPAVAVASDASGDPLSRNRQDVTGCERMADALEEAVARAMSLASSHAPGQPHRLNLLVSDGESTVACRWASEGVEPESLYVSHGYRYLCELGVCRMIDPAEGRGSRAALVSSEPLYDSAKWESVPRNHLVMVHGSLDVEIREMRPT
jgi:glutamine amidotransferase